MLVDQKVKNTWYSFNKKYYENLGYVFTKIGDEFEVDVNDLPKGSDKKIKYICDYCNGKRQIEEKNKWKRYADYNKYRKLTGKDCCNNKVCKSLKLSESQMIVNIPNGNSLADKFPEISREWNFDKNTQTPHEYAMKSNRLVWWVCPKGHEYDMRICDRTGANKVNCPYCAGYRVNETNCLATTHPELSKQWNYLKNKDVTPSSIFTGSYKKIWWICEKGHEWEISVRRRTVGGTGCPYCAGQKVCIDNCLATLYPELSKEWDYTKNGDLTPYDISSGSGKKVWWRCSKYENHIWKATVCNRVIGRGCPICHESKGEKKIRKWLETNSLIFESQKEFNGLLGIGGGKLSYDFYLASHNLLIEYQGVFHDGNGNSFVKENLQYQLEHDRRKREYAKQTEIQLMEIWYWDFENIEEILSKKLIRKVSEI